MNKNRITAFGMAAVMAAMVVVILTRIAVMVAVMTVAAVMVMTMTVAIRAAMVTMVTAMTIMAAMMMIATIPAAIRRQMMVLQLMMCRYRRIAVVRIPMMSSIRIWIRHFLR